MITSRGGRDQKPVAADMLLFTVNVERLKPWHTLTGRMHFFLDHDWMRDLVSRHVPSTAGHAPAVRRADSWPRWSQASDGALLWIYT